MLMLKGLVQSLFQIAVFAAVLLVPGGTLHWPRAIQFLVAYAVLSAISIVALARWAPASLEARVERGVVKGQSTADKIAFLAIGVSNLAWFVLVAVDVNRIHLLPQPPIWISGLGAMVAFAGYILMFVVVWWNPYAAPAVGKQRERHQVVIESGPYGRIRHPMYLGDILFLTGLGLWLGSVVSVFVMPVVAVPFVARILIEEHVLQDDLPGYSDYMSEVPYRLAPRVW
jgi:protein-S-isoprenylcysteine O-methyltransferase Ste14